MSYINDMLSEDGNFYYEKFGTIDPKAAGYAFMDLGELGDNELVSQIVHLSLNPTTTAKLLVKLLEENK